MTTNQSAYARYSIGTALIALVIGVLLGASFHKETVVVREGTANTPAAMTSVNLMVDYGDGRVRTWNTVSWHEAMSVMNLLETVTSAENITLTPLVTDGKNAAPEAVDAITNDPKLKMRWQYWINNTYEPRVANKYFLKPGDMVVWKFVKEQKEVQ